MKQLNYREFMDLKPTLLAGTEIASGFYEHPVYGDEHPVIAVHHIFEYVENTHDFDIPESYRFEGLSHLIES